MENSEKLRTELNTQGKFRYAGIDWFDVCNGLDVGLTIYFQGCSHHCPGCHNPKTHDFNGGKLFHIGIFQSILDYLYKYPQIRRVSFSGGDPVDQPEFCKTLANLLKFELPSIKLWLYTGYDFNEISNDIKRNFDYIVDGKFELEKRDITLPFRGSSNQNIYVNVNDEWKKLNE